MPTLQIGKATPSVNGQPVLFPDGFSAQDFMDHLNAAAQAGKNGWVGRRGFLFKNFFYGGKPLDRGSDKQPRLGG